ncbi:MAG: hypothetical protein KDI34_22990, partial [Halioglobus sp.]|nr:hypothetical protein [Halioglobus sp.]
VMTLHKAKGLEFDMVILPQLARSPRPDGRQLMLWDEHGDLEGERRFLLAADDHSGPGEPTLYNYLQQRRAEKNALEGTRLLYVGATRAIRQLLLSAGLREDPASGELLAPPQRSLLGPIWDSFQAQMIRHDAETPPAPTTAVQRRPLVRLRHPAAAAAAPPVADGANVPVRAANLQQRCVGTVVHLALEDLSRLERLP